MRIGINISPIIQDRSTGVQLMARYMTEHLISQFPQAQFVLTGIVPRKAIPTLMSWSVVDQKNVEIRVLKVPQRWMRFLAEIWQRSGILPIEWITGKLDVFHQYDWFSFPSIAPQTTTVFDCTPLLFPQWHTKENVNVFINRMKRVVGWSHHIFAISMSTKRDVEKWYPSTRTHISVVYPDCSFEFKPISQSKTQLILRKHAIESGYFLFVGTIEPRKNLERLLEAYSKINKLGVTRKLVIVGAKGWKQTKQLQRLSQTTGVVWLDYVDIHDLPSLYCGAKVLVFPSLYEGFGLPVLESMKCGTIVITSRTGGLNEVGGNVVSYCDPFSIDSIAVKMMEAHRLSSEKQLSLIQKGFEQSQQFSFFKSCQNMMDLWLRILNKD